MKRLKVLISAYACSPYQGSEPGVGWGFVKTIAQHHDLWVLVEDEKFRADIEKYLDSVPPTDPVRSNVKFIFIRKQRNRLLRKLWPPSYYWYYEKWQKDAFKAAKALHQKNQFDLAHHLTMVGFREPGYLWELGIPYVWGPAGGTENVPWRLTAGLPLKHRLRYVMHNLINHRDLWHKPRVKAALTRAQGSLIAATQIDQINFEKAHHQPSLLLSEIGFDTPSHTALSCRPAHQPFRIIWSGVHEARKRLDLAIRVMQQLDPQLPITLHITGKGPESTRCQTLAKDLKVADKCIFHGKVTRDQSCQLIRDAHVMLLTSIRDLTTTVMVEALSAGIPVICIDNCGFAGIIDASCGIKIAANNIDDIVIKIANGVQQLYHDEALRQKLCSGALEKSRQFDWISKAAAINSVYSDAISQK